MRFGHSKDHRPDLRQFKVRLGTLDPVGLPLATATLSGEQADDPQYLPAWERLVATIGQPDFLVVGDCKLASLETRARIQQGGGFYLTPLPMTGQTPAELQAWVCHPPAAPQAIRLPGQLAHEPPVAVVDIEARHDDLIIGTRGRSVWILDDVQPLRGVPS